MGQILMQPLLAFLSNRPESTSISVTQRICDNIARGQHQRGHSRADTIANQAAMQEAHTSTTIFRPPCRTHETLTRADI